MFPLNLSTWSAGELRLCSPADRQQIRLGVDQGLTPPLELGMVAIAFCDNSVALGLEIDLFAIKFSRPALQTIQVDLQPFESLLADKVRGIRSVRCDVLTYKTQVAGARADLSEEIIFEIPLDCGQALAEASLALCELSKFAQHLLGSGVDKSSSRTFAFRNALILAIDFMLRDVDRPYA
jgi:hypothetical protein